MRTAQTSALSRMPYSWRLGITAAAALLVVMGTFIATAGPASADDPRVSVQGDDYAFINGNEDLVVCDMERDGHGVYAEWQTIDGTGYAWDHNGSSPPCYTYGQVVAFRVCEDISFVPDPCDDWNWPYIGIPVE